MGFFLEQHCSASVFLPFFFCVLPRVLTSGILVMMKFLPLSTLLPIFTWPNFSKCFLLQEICPDFPHISPSLNIFSCTAKCLVHDK